MLHYFFQIFLRYIKWYFNGKPMVKYEGSNCGCCGAWSKKPFSIPEYDSDGKFYDTWRICDKCAGMENINKESTI